MPSLPPQAFGRVRDAFPGASTALVGLQTVGSPLAFSGPSEPASWPRTCKPAFIKKQKGRLAASPPRPPAAWPRQAVRGCPLGSKPVRIKGVRSGSSMWGPSASRDPRDRDQHYSTGFPTVTGSAEDPLQRLEDGGELFRPDRPPFNVQTSREFPRGPGPLRLSSVGTSCTTCLGIGHDPTYVSPVSRLVNS